MSGAITIAAIAGATAMVGGTIYSAAQGNKAQKAQNQAQNQARQQADAQAKQAQQSMNAANQKAPNTNAILSAAQQAGKGGASGTMLTGPQGIDPNALSLGKSTLLGQ